MSLPEADVVVTHSFTAAAERVYDGFLDAATAGKFMFLAPNGKIVRAESDGRVGGALTYADLRDGQEVLHTGQYLELERPRRIVFEFAVPKYSVQKARVQIDLVPAGEGCEVTLTHFAVPAMWREGARAQWARTLENAAGVLG